LSASQEASDVAFTQRLSFYRDCEGTSRREFFKIGSLGAGALTLRGLLAERAHFVMTGYDNRKVDAGGPANRPAIGSIVARVRGANHPASGMPTYVRLGGIGSDGPSFLGTACAPFDPGGQARKNMQLGIDPRAQFINAAGRHVYMLEDGRPIAELIG
jgi:hypothetical protein